jgi:hypothetical protein
MCLCREVSTPDECGILNAGPASCKRLTEKSYALLLGADKTVPPLPELV